MHLFNITNKEHNKMKNKKTASSKICNVHNATHHITSHQRVNKEEHVKYHSIRSSAYQISQAEVGVDISMISGAIQ
jgi:hypothetical protein